MRKLKPSVKAAISSTLILTSVIAIAYANPNAEKSTDTSSKLKLDVERVDSDTVKVAIDNIQDIPKALQFSIKLEGATLKDGEKSIRDLVEKEVQTRLKNSSTKSNEVLTDYTYNKDTNTIDVLITAENTLPKVSNKVDIFELDVEGSTADTLSYKIVPTNEAEYKYVSNTNKEYSNLGVIHDNEEIALTAKPTIKSTQGYINIIEDEKLDLTLDSLKDKIGLVVNHEDGDNDLTIEVKQGNNVITEFTQNTPGIYDLKITAIKDGKLRSQSLDLKVNVSLDNITDAPTITRDGKNLDDITIDGGSIFKPLENVKAVDKKGRNVNVEVKVDKELDLDPEEDTTYTLTYTATDIYNNIAKKEITLAVVANKAPIISGVKDKTIKVGDTFNPAEGVTVTDDRDKDIELKIDSNVNTSIPGTYKVSYSATDSKGKTTRLQSKVTVNPKASIINKVPTINAQDKTVELGKEFDPKVGVTATDAEDKDITSSIKVIKNDVNINEEGSYTVVYSVTDSKGATAIKTITVKVEKKVILAESITIDNKSNNKMYIGNTKTISASINKEADSKDINWEISDEEIATLKVVDNKAEIVAKKPGKLTITASTKDGSNKSDSIIINVTDFKNDDEVPEYIRDVIDTNVLLPVVEENSSVVFEIKDITEDEFNNFLEKIDNLLQEVKELEPVDGFRVYRIKLTQKARLFRKAQENYIKIRVSNNLSNVDVINEKLTKLSNLVPVIIISSNQSITVGDKFNPLSIVTAYDKNGIDITKDVEVEGKVDTSKAGDYELTYKVKDAAGRENSITVVITVKESTATQQPENGDINKPGEDVDTPDNEENTNKPDENIDTPNNEENTNKPGEDIDVPDNEENTDNYQTNSIPVIKINSSSNTILVGDKFDPLEGVTAYDEEDKDITNLIKVEGKVDTSKPGKYKLIYTVKDKDGNIATFTRIIIVKDKNISTNENDNTIVQTGDSSIMGYVGAMVIAAGGIFIGRKKLK